MFGLNIWRPELAGLVARKEDDAPRFFRITFKHIALPLESPLGTAGDPGPTRTGTLWPYYLLCNQEATEPTTRSCSFLTRSFATPVTGTASRPSTPPEHPGDSCFPGLPG